MPVVFEGKMDVFDCTAEVLVIPVNTFGAMGKGLALAYKERFNEGYRAYRDYCFKSKLLEVGVPILHADHCSRATLFFPTKKHWSDPSRLEWIEQGLEYFSQYIDDFGFSSYAFVPLGCGNGQLDYYRKVRPLMYKYLDALEVDIHICF